MLRHSAATSRPVRHKFTASLGTAVLVGAALLTLDAAPVAAAPAAWVDPPNVELTVGPGQSAAVAKHVTTPWIVYQSSWRDGQFGDEGIFLVHPGGGDDHEIATDAPGWRVHPSWSKDGRQLVFGVGEDVRELYIADGDGTHARRLSPCTGDCLTDDDGAFSPDGHQIAYEEVLGPLVTDLEEPSAFELRVATIGQHGAKHVRTLVRTETGTEIDAPRWSPDGTSLVFWEGHYDASGAVDRTAVFTVRADGSHLRRLTAWAMDAGEADWSPDGRRIVLVTHPAILFNFVAVVSNLYTIRPDGHEMRQLTHATTPDVRSTQARFMPDGRIIYTRIDQDGRSIWTIDIRGRHATPAAPGGRPIRTHPELQPQPRR